LGRPVLWQEWNVEETERIASPRPTTTDGPDPDVSTADVRSVEAVEHERIRFETDGVEGEERFLRASSTPSNGSRTPESATGSSSSGPVTTRASRAASSWWTSSATPMRSSNRSAGRGTRSSMTDHSYGRL